MTNAAHSLPDSLPLIIGHRGASGDAPENTLAAFAQAMKDGADGVEFDVRLARDGVPVVIHDATLIRTARRDGAVAAHSSAELREMDAGTWFNLKFPSRARESFAREWVPTLAEALELVGARARAIYVELKIEEGDDHQALTAAVVREIRARNLGARAIVESFTHDAIAGVKRIAPEVRTAALFERSLSRPILSGRRLIERALAAGADEIALHRSLVRRRLVEAARQRGMRSLVWTADDPLWVQRALAYKLCAVITNQPGRLRAALADESA